MGASFYKPVIVRQKLLFQVVIEQESPILLAHEFVVAQEFVVLWVYHDALGDSLRRHHHGPVMNP